MREIKLITGITNGRPENLEQFYENCKYFEGKKVDIIIERHKTKRTNKQNSFYRGVMLPMIVDFMESFGFNWTAKDYNDLFISKGYFGYKEVNGEQIPKSSSEATTLEMNDAWEKIQRDFAPKGLIIPDPNQEDFL